MLLDKAVSLAQEFDKALGTPGVGHRCSHKREFLFAGLGDLCLDLSRVRRPR